MATDLRGRLNAHVDGLIRIRPSQSSPIIGGFPEYNETEPKEFKIKKAELWIDVLEEMIRVGSFDYVRQMKKSFMFANTFIFHPSGLSYNEMILLTAEHEGEPAFVLIKKDEIEFI